jgi:hypothetical protein
MTHDEIVKEIGIIVRDELDITNRFIIESLEEAGIPQEYFPLLKIICRTMMVEGVHWRERRDFRVKQLLERHRNETRDIKT